MKEVRIEQWRGGFTITFVRGLTTTDKLVAPDLKEAFREIDNYFEQPDPKKGEVRLYIP